MATTAEAAGTPIAWWKEPTKDQWMTWVAAWLDQGKPDDIIALHGGLSPGGADDNPGEERAVVDGVTFERGSTLLLRPGTDRDPFDRILDGRSATLERIYLDYDDRVYLAVTVDDDPGQELMRETGRYLYFFAQEVEVIDE